MNRKEVIKKYIEFFKKKGHAVIPSAPLVPENDPTVLFTTAGMHPLVPFLMGRKHPSGKRIVDVQKCLRTVGIHGKKLGDELFDEVGDKTHHTFFEMLGNWSLGDYFKKEAIEMSFEFLTKILKIPAEKLAISCFKGDKNAPKDIESAKVWESLGIPKERIAFLGKEDNWWGPAGKTGPCGPDTEIFYWTGEKVSKKFNPNDKRWVEIWNDVFMQYNKKEDGSYEELKQKNVDTGMGVERVVTILNGFDDDYLTGLFKPIIEKIEKLSKKKYNFTKGDLGFKEMPTCWANDMRAMRIIADHIKASVFIIAGGVLPSNTEQGYILRRLIRRAIRYGKKLDMKNFVPKIAEPVFEIYDDYPELKKNKEKILIELNKEEKRFLETLEKGVRVFEKIAKNKISGKDAFLLYQSYGFPIEMTVEMAKEKKIKVDEKSFEEEQEKHQEKSRTATAGRFKSGLADDSQMTTKMHTATHLLLSALRKVLKKEIRQRGSNITAERIRFDFNFERKLSDEEIKEVEDVVNDIVKKGINVEKKEMSFEEAKKIGAGADFESKYGEKVFVYKIGYFSIEVCAGPHVKNTKEIGKFKIVKEGSSSGGVRRIKAVLES